MAETINTQTTGYECVGIEKIEQTYEGLFDNKPNIITIYLTNGDTHQFKVMNGSQGVGIDRIEQRQTSTTNGGRNEFAIILTNGKEYTFSTYNGSGGSGSSGSFNQVLQHLNNLLMPSGKSYLYYNGSGFEWKSPDGSTGGGTADLSEYSWWGRKFDPASKSITGEMSGVTGIEFQSTNGETVIRKKLYLDENGDLCFNGNLYATGGITALGSGGGTSGGSGASLGTLLTKLNSDNPFPTANGQVLTYDGSNFIWKTPTTNGGTSGGGTGGSLKLLEVINKTGSTFFAYNGETAYRLRFGDGLNMVLDVDEYVVTATGGSGSGVTLNPTMSAMNDQLDKTKYGTPQFLYWNGSTYTWKNESEISGGGGSIQVAQTPEYAGGSENWVSTTKLRFVGITGTKPTIRTNSEKSCVDVGIPVGSGSGSSGTTSGRLRFYKDSSEESWNGESDFKIIFGSGLNVTWDSHSQITLSAIGGSSTGGSVDLSSYLTKTDAASTYAPKSHSHIASDITNFVSSVKAVKVNSATNADKATQLANTRLIWGQSFNGTGDINGNLKMGTAGGGSIQLWMNGGNMLDRTNNTLHIGYGLKASSDGEIWLDAYATRVYNSNYGNHYDFKGNVFDVNSNNIHFGYETNGGKISWDANNNAFKIEGNVYATGGITALGVSNSATTSNNVDFTFKSVTANTFNVKKIIQLSDSLSLNRYGKDVYLANTDNAEHYIYLDGTDENYYLASGGDAYFSTLNCETLNISSVQDFRISEISSNGFKIQFEYNGKIYSFIPSEGSVTVS